MNDKFRKMVIAAFDEVLGNTKPKPTKSDWEQNSDKLQQKEQDEQQSEPLAKKTLFDELE